MSQPVTGDEYKIVSAAGTTVIQNQPVSLTNVLIPGTYIGSVEWYDTNATAGTAATNLVFNVGIPALNLGRTNPMNVQFKTGMVVVATGTPTLTYTISK